MLGFLKVNGGTVMAKRERFFLEVTEEAKNLAIEAGFQNKKESISKIIVKSLKRKVKK